MATSPALPPSPPSLEQEAKLVAAPAADFPGAFVAGPQQAQYGVVHPAQFPGSFIPVAEYRRDNRVRSRRRDWRSRVVQYLVDGWGNREIWKSAFIETVGTMIQCYLSALIHLVLVNLQMPSQVAPFVGISNIFVISIFIYAVAPGSGGHLNPMITFATMVTGLTGFARGIMYMIGQTLGGAVAGGLVRGSLGIALTETYQGGGCLIDGAIISEGQAFLIEAILCFTAIFLAFGVGLDPRQAKLFGPRMSPFLVGCVIGLTSFASVGLAPGYVGAGLNPARCFSAAVARGSFQHQWIWWIGPLSGSILQGITYNVAPPYHREEKEKHDNQA